MNSKPLISITIPTYNRARFSESLLNTILPQAEKLVGDFEVCISNNASTDDTRGVVMDFQKKYPGLVRYHENKENVGIDKNIFIVMEMARGGFIWGLCDDDSVVSDGLKRVVDFIKNYGNENTGLIFLGYKSYALDAKTGTKRVYFDTVEHGKPKMYQIDMQDVAGIRSGNSFLSVMLFNNDVMKKTLQEEREAINQAVGNYYIHVFWFQLMFLKYQNLQILKYNEDIIYVQEVHYYKFYIEDDFEIYYVAWKRLNHLLLSSPYMNDSCREVIVKEDKKIRRRIIKEMGLLKAFGASNYTSFWGCVTLFFRQATLVDALLISASFFIFSVTPSLVLKNLYKSFIKIKYKKDWQHIWFGIANYSESAKGTRRLVW